MVITQSEFDAMLAKNPHLRVSRRRGAAPAQANVSKLLAAAQKGQKSAKYWNYKVFIHERGISTQSPDKDLGKVLDKFDSIKEYSRYGELQMLERAGEISDLRRQVPILIQEAFDYDGTHIAAITYKADFVYKNPQGRTCVEDVKGFDESTGKYRTTKDFDLKWKLLKCKYPDNIFVIV